MPGVSNSIDRFNGLVASLAIKAPCVAVAIANITLSGEQTVNGVAVVTDDRVLVIAQTSSVDNGIYNVSSSAWARAADFDGNRDVVSGTFVTVATANVGRNPYYQVTTANPITIGTTAINFTLADGPNVSYTLIQAEIDEGLTDNDIDDSFVVGFVARYGGVGDAGSGDTNDVPAVQTAANVMARIGGGPVVLMETKSFVSSTMKFPLNTYPVGNGKNSGFVPDPAGSFTNDWVIFLNTTDGLNWTTAFPVVPSGEVGNFAIDNSDNLGTTRRGILVAGGYRIKNISTDGLSQVIKTTDDYIDQLYISQIYGAQTQGTDYQIDIQLLGDGLNIDAYHFTGSSTINSLKVNGSAGAHIRGGIGGNHLFRTCLATKVESLHLETGTITIDDSSLEIANSYLWPAAVPRIKFLSTDDAGHVVKLTNVQFMYMLDAEPASYDEFDLQTHDNYQIIIEGCSKHISKSGSINIGQSAGILVKNQAGSALAAFNDYSHLLSTRGVIGYRQTPELSHSLDLGSGNIFQLSNKALDSDVTWQLATDTYFYNSQMLYDVPRLIGQNNADPEISILLTNLSSGLIIPIGYNTRKPNCILRLYRGIATNSFDFYVDIPVLALDDLYDDGNNVNGFPWIARSAGGRDAPTDTVSTARWTGPKFEGWRDATPVAAVATFQVGDIMWKEAPVAAGVIGQVCTTSGTPGTWKDFGTIAA